MKARTTVGWVGEVRGVPVTQIDVEAGETLEVTPGPGTRAFVVLLPADGQVQKP